jgi:hypothetical protein
LLRPRPGVLPPRDQIASLIFSPTGITQERMSGSLSRIYTLVLEAMSSQFCCELGLTMRQEARFFCDRYREYYSSMGLSRTTRLTDKSDDVYYDYFNIMVGYQFDATKIQ